MRIYELADGNRVIFANDAAAEEMHPGAWTFIEERLPPASTRLTKRAFWTRFPQANFVAMQAILRSGSPALLAGMLGANQLLVSDSPFVDLSLRQTVDALTGPSGLTSAAYPATVTIDSQVLPLRLTAEQADAILAPPVGEEVFNG